MKPAPFHYAAPLSVDDAVALLVLHGTAARLLAGGQTLMPLMTQRLQRPGWVIDLNRIAGLDQIDLSPTHVSMGALVRQEQARRCPVVREELAGVAEALAYVANPGVRRRGTVVGNLVTNSPGAELPAVAMALNAEFVLRHPASPTNPAGAHVTDIVETVPAAAVLGPGRHVPANALVTHVRWPRRPGASGFYEVARRDGHAPVVSAMVHRSGGDCRVALSGVCAHGLSCNATAQVIARRFPEVPGVDELSSALPWDLTGPVYGDAYSSARYRLEVAPEIILRAARLMATHAGSPSSRN